MPNITTTTAAVFLPEVWSMETLRAAEKALVMAGLVKRYDSLVKSRGDTIHVPNISNLSANDKTQGSETTTQTITESETTISINKWKEASFEIEDIVKVQSNFDLMSEYTSKAKQNWSCKTISDQWGKPERVTLSKLAEAWQLQRLSEMDYESSKRQSELLLN